MIIDLFIDSFLTREGKGDLFYSPHLYLIEDHEQQQGACCHVYTVPQFSTRQADRSTSVTKRLYFSKLEQKKPSAVSNEAFLCILPIRPWQKCFFFLLFFEYRRIFFFQRLSRTFLTPVTVYRYSSLILTVLISLFRKGTFSLRLVWTEFDNNKTITISAVRSPDCYDYSILPYRKRILWKKKIRENLLSQMFIL